MVIWQSRPFDLPRKGNPLQLDHFLTEVQSLLDECYRKTTAGFVNGEISILLNLALDTRGGQLLPYPKSLREIEAISNNTLDRQHLRKFVDEHLPLILHRRHTKHKNKHLLGYSVSHWLCNFTFDPNRSRSLYSTSLVTRVCQRAIDGFIEKNSGFNPKEFFVQYDEISDASRLLEHAKNGPDSDDLLLFLQYLSKIQWLNIYTQDWEGRFLTYAIIQWVCTTLVS